MAKFTPSSKTSPWAFSTLALAFLVAACTTPTTDVGSIPQNTLGQNVATETLQRAQKAYDAGDYKRTVLLLRGEGASAFAAADAATKLEAMKLEAFSYCVMDQPQECSQQFQSILREYPGFELSVAERSHPQWGPAYYRAKRAPVRR